MSKPVVEANGRLYAWPTNPVIVVCMDGSEPGYESSDGGGYIERAIEAGVMPFMARMIETGTQRLADCVVPGAGHRRLPGTAHSTFYSDAASGRYPAHDRRHMNK